jgi:hypothetical protein
VERTGAGAWPHHHSVYDCTTGRGGLDHGCTVCYDVEGVSWGGVHPINVFIIERLSIPSADCHFTYASTLHPLT